MSPEDGPTPDDAAAPAAEFNPADYSNAHADNCVLFPAGDRIIIRRDEANKVTPGGIALPDTAQDNRTTRGTVVAVGPGEFSPHLCDDDGRPGGYSPMPFSVGDVVLYAKYAGNEVEVAGTDFLVLRVSDVLVKVVPNKAPPAATS